ncbi:MAG: efflux RND transporter periplasmic adaptor subunit [Rhodobacterales bacterium]|nr:efflux RND transporter periplasmic adaptor subunit [Rhodobacterales bacterium]
MNRVYRLFLMSALALPMTGLPAMAEEKATPVAATEPALSLPAITVSTVSPAVLRDRIVATGLIAAVEQAQVQPLIEGQAIEELLADVGDVVTQGQVLARLSGSTIELQRSELMASRAQVEASIAQSQASLIESQTTAAEADRVAERTKSLLANGNIPQATADEAIAAAGSAAARVNVAEQGIASAQAQLALVDAQLDTLELNRARTEVKAPVAGLIVTRNATVGTIASAGGQPMFTIVRDGQMELRAEVSEQDLLRLQPGQRVSMRSISGGTPITGEVRLVEPTIDTQSRLAIARITVDNDALVRAGMFLTAEIIVSEGEMLSVPVTAVQSGPSGASVMRVRDGVVEQVPVTVGVRDGSLIGIFAGLDAGDLVVTRAAAFVRPGDQINPVPAPESSAPGQEG